MLVQLLSDIHGREREISLSPDAELVVIAGDLCNGIEAAEWLLSLKRKVIWVPGNHERYGPKWASTEQRAREIFPDGGNVLWGNKRRFDIMGIRFLCATLWPDFGGGSPSSAKAAMERMNDFRAIGDNPSGRAFLETYTMTRGIMVDADPSMEGRLPEKPGKFNPASMLAMHYSDLSFLTRELSVPFGGPTIVVTHHSPSPHGCWLSGFAPTLEAPPSWLKIPSVKLPLMYNPVKTAGYSASLDWLLSKFKPNMWMHGHFHQNIRYAMYDTEIITNPAGSAVEPNHGWSSSMLIDAGNLAARLPGAKRAGLEKALVMLRGLSDALDGCPKGTPPPAFITHSIRTVVSFFGSQTLDKMSLVLPSISEKASDVSEMRRVADEIAGRIERNFSGMGWPLPF